MNLSRFFKTPQPLLPKFSFQDLQNSESRVKLSKSQFFPRQHHIFDLILVFMAALIEGDIALANQRLGELETCSPEEIRRIFHECEVEAGCVSVLTKFPSSTNFSGRVIWGLLNQFLQQYSTSYHQALFNPIIPRSTKKIHKFEYVQEINPNVQVDCFVRKKWRWQDPGSRDHEMGPRITKGFEYGGWKSRYFDVELSQLKRASETLAKSHPRVCIFDIECAYLNLGPDLEGCLGLIEKNYDVKIAVLFDAWQPQTKAMMTSMMPYFDHIWCPMPSSMDDIAVVHRGNAILFPFPQGVSLSEISRIRGTAHDRNSIGFSGGIGLANPARINWVAALAPYGAVNVEISPHIYRNPDPVADYIEYLTRSAKHKTGLNFSVRYSGARVATGRGFEVPLVGGLLLQEYADDMRYYFTPDEHYLEFTDFGSLIDRVEWLACKPTEAAKLSAAGQNYFDNFYSNIHLVQNFSTII
jgi:hypothetical protein